MNLYLNYEKKILKNRTLPYKTKMCLMEINTPFSIINFKFLKISIYLKTEIKQIKSRFFLAAQT